MGRWEAGEKHGPGRFVSAARHLVTVGEWVRGVARAGELTAVDSGRVLRLPELELADAEGALARGVAEARAGPADDDGEHLGASWRQRAAAAPQTSSTASYYARGADEDDFAAFRDASTHNSRPSTSASFLGPSDGGGGGGGGGGDEQRAAPYALDAGALGLTPGEAAQLEAAFRSVDDTGCGYIPADPAAVRLALLSLGIDTDDEDLRHLLAQLTGNADDVRSISFAAFAAMLAQLREG